MFQHGAASLASDDRSRSAASSPSYNVLGGSSSIFSTSIAQSQTSQMMQNALLARQNSALLPQLAARPGTVIPVMVSPGAGTPAQGPSLISRLRRWAGV